MTRIAVIADPHFHDTSWRPKGSGLSQAMRSYNDTASSTRVFNESIPAFRAALECAAAEDAKLVIIVGDLTDDGQEPNIKGAMALLDYYHQHHAMRFYSTLGNHDVFAIEGRQQTKEFSREDGQRVVLTSDPRTPDRSAIFVPEMATMGTLPGLKLLASLGFVPQAGDLHWETPFGSSADFDDRTYLARSHDGTNACRMIDASYLVEPVAGIWLMSIDANICTPKDGAIDVRQPSAYMDPTDGGWDALLDQRSYLLTWMSDVAKRARASGKQLIAFSHYPALDPLAGTSEAEVALFGATGLAGRAPSADVAKAFAKTGVPVHLSGHLHVNDTALYHDENGRFVNVAVPSPVGFPPAFKIIDVKKDVLGFRSFPLVNVPDHSIAFASYRAEAECLGEMPPAAAAASDHAAFIDAHLGELVTRRYVAREWPEDMKNFADTNTIQDLLDMLGIVIPSVPVLSLRELRVDWYRLRKGGDEAYRHISPERINFYRTLAGRLEGIEGDGLAAKFLIFFRIMKRYLDRLPSSNFVIRTDDLTIESL
jgi:3',5'-cyclic AMP phosphodiesterase CpdA